MEANGPKASGCAAQDPAGVHRIAQEFESLLIGQLLKAMQPHESSPEANGASSSVFEYAQESLARVMSQNGGLGLAKLIEQGLSQQSQPSHATAGSPPASGPEEPNESSR